MVCAAPRVSAASITQAASRSRSNAPLETSGSAGVSAKVSSVSGRVASMDGRPAIADARSARCRPPCRSATISRPAPAASSANIAFPLSRPPAAVTPAPSRAPAIGSEIATPAVTSPAASFGSQRAFCSDDPASFNANGASTAEPRNGVGATTPPSASAASMASTSPSSNPPCSAPIIRPGRPRSDSPCQISGALVSPPSANRRTRSSGERSASVRTRLSCNSVWSSESANLMPPPPWARVACPGHVRR